MKTTRAEAILAGDTYYVTGKPCNRGHTVKRLTSSAGCYECRKISRKKSRSTEEYRVKFKKYMRMRREDKDIITKEALLQSEVRSTDEYRNKARQYFRAYRERNKGKIQAHRIAREVAKIDRTPPWLTDIHKAETVSIYEECKRITKDTGIPHHVDHIIPLRGKLVSGLHVPWDLQILTAKENLSKGNRV